MFLCLTHVSSRAGNVPSATRRYKLDHAKGELVFLFLPATLQGGVLREPLPQIGIDDVFQHPGREPVADTVHEVQVQVLGDGVKHSPVHRIAVGKT